MIDDRLELRIDKIADDVTTIKTALVGIDGKNGLTGRSLDHETRLRGLERWRWGLPISAVIAAGSIAAAVWGGR